MYVLHLSTSPSPSLSLLCLQAIWEWGDPAKGEWHPFERDTNTQIEDMYDNGSQWAELTLCLPSPMPFLLDLHDMKLVNFRTAVRYSLRRVDNSHNLQSGVYKLLFLSPFLPHCHPHLWYTILQPTPSIVCSLSPIPSPQPPPSHSLALLLQKTSMPGAFKKSVSHQ